MSENKTRKKKNIIRAGDLVRLKPGVARVVQRVGYPKTTKDYLEQAQEILRPVYKAAKLSFREEGRTAYALARDIGYKDHFGGRNRELHFSPVSPWYTEIAYIVKEVVTRYTGDKYDTIRGGGGGYYGEDEYWEEPGGIANAVAHRIVITEEGVSSLTSDGCLSSSGPALGFLVTDLEKIEKNS